MMRTAIIGGGLAGSCLAKLLFERGESFHWYIDHKPAASHISSGILNPVTGRRYALAWRYDEFIQLAVNFYGEYLEPIRLEKHFSPFKEDTTIEDVIRGKENYLSKINEEWIEVKESFQLRTHDFINSIVKKIDENQGLISTKFNHASLHFGESRWHYQNQEYDQLIFAEGVQVKNNPFFHFLPFQPNRGEALLIDIPSDKPHFVKKYGKFICPFGDKFWIGSSFDKVEFDAPLLTEKTKQDLINAIPLLVGHSEYKISDHLGAMRSTSPDRRPLLGEHPLHKGLYIFNGFGTKGASLIPWCAEELMEFIYDTKAMTKEISILRF